MGLQQTAPWVYGDLATGTLGANGRCRRSSHKARASGKRGLHLPPLILRRTRSMTLMQTRSGHLAASNSQLPQSDPLRKRDTEVHYSAIGWETRS